MIHDLPGDLWITLAFQSLGDWLTPLMSFFTWLGYPQAYMIIIAMIYWSIDRKLGLRLAIFLPLVASLNSILKQALHAPRPFWLDPEIKAIRVSNGFGMPSGHAQAAVVWLYAAAYLKKGWIWMLAILVVILVGLSRVYLGVHFSSQVLAGWLIGIALLVLFVRLEGKILNWFLRRNFFTQLAWICGIALWIVILGAVVVYLFRDWEIPRDWIRNSADDLAGRDLSILSSRGLAAIAGNAGGFLGTALGALLIHRKCGFEAAGPVRGRLMRGLAGLLSTGLIYGMVMWIAPDEAREALYSAWRFCGFFVISFHAIFILPLIFKRFKLFK